MSLHGEKFYYHKYLKYKNKYINLLHESQIGGFYNDTKLHKLEEIDRDEHIGQETIFDKISNVQENLIRDLPTVHSLCNDIVILKSGYTINKIYYEIEGNIGNPPIVLCAGGPGCSHEEFHPYFSKLKNYFMVIYFDMRGTGKSIKDQTYQTYNLETVTKDLDVLREHLKIDKWNVLGFSFGGELAQIYTLLYPNRVSKLILVASVPLSAEYKPHNRYSLSVLEEENKKILEIKDLGKDGLIDLNTMIFNMHMNGYWKRQLFYRPTPEKIMLMTISWYDELNKHFNRQKTPNIMDVFLKNSFEKLNIPTLIIEGKWDLTWTDEKFDLMKKIHPHSYMFIFERSGHEIFSDEYHKFFYLIKKFIEEAT